MKFKMFFLIILTLILIFVSFLFIGNPPQAEKITWGVNFSQKQTELLKLNWQETYLALLDDLKVKNIKLLTHWDLIEPKEGEYNFEDLDWQIKTAEEKGAKLLLVVGMKTGRWPECHIPDWAKNKNKEEQQEEILELLEQIVLRYRGRPPVNFWQVENEPFFSFGECPKLDKGFLKKEINLVKSLTEKPVIISDSGEFSFWVNAAKSGDMVGATLHRKVWLREFKIYISYPFKPIFYWRKAQLIKKFFDKKVISVELQAEPWCSGLLDTCLPEEQIKTMTLGIFKENIEFAKKTGLDTFYLWSGEWWYWLRVKQGDSSVWDEARKLWQ